MKIINNDLIDKTLLLLFALEYLLFGLWGLVDPIAISNMIGLTFSEITAFSEFRAQYTFFTALGVLPLIAFFKKEIQMLKNEIINIKKIVSELVAQVAILTKDGEK